MNIFVTLESFKIQSKCDESTENRRIQMKHFSNICFLILPFFNFIYSLVNQTMANLDVGRVKTILSESLDVWSRGSRLTFREELSDKSDIQVLFAR